MFRRPPARTMIFAWVFLLLPGASWLPYEQSSTPSLPHHYRGNGRRCRHPERQRWAGSFVAAQFLGFGDQLSHCLSGGLLVLLDVGQYVISLDPPIRSDLTVREFAFVEELNEVGP